MKTSCPEAGAEGISLFDLLHVLLRHWWKIVLFSLVAVGVSAVCCKAKSPTYEANVFLDGGKYDILFDDQPGTNQQHLVLATSTGFLARVSERMKQEGMVDNKAGDSKRLFNISPARGAKNTFFVSVSQPTSEKAVRALQVWAEEYMKLARSCRAQRCVYDLKQSLFEATAALALRRESFKTFLREWRPGIDGREFDSLSVSNGIMELEAELISREYNNQISRDTINQFMPLCNPSYSVSATTNIEDAAMSFAWRMIDRNADQVLGDPQPVRRRSRTKAKILVVFLLSLGFASSVAFVVERARFKEPSGEASSYGSASK